jgi:hypothetical protein
LHVPLHRSATAGSPKWWSESTKWDHMLVEIPAFPTSILPWHSWLCFLRPHFYADKSRSSLLSPPTFQKWHGKL